MSSSFLLDKQVFKYRYCTPGSLWTWNLYGGWAGGETFFWSLPPAPGMENGVLGRNGRRRSSASCWCGSRALLLSLLPKRKWWRMSWRVSSKMNCAFSYSIFNLRLLPDVLLRPIHTTSRASRLPFADEENMRGATSHVSPFFLERPVFGVWLCWFLWLLLWVVFVLLSCFSFDGLSSDQTYESTYDSMPGVAKTATIVMMSAASVQKKNAPIVNCEQPVLQLPPPKPVACRVVQWSFQMCRVFRRRRSLCII